MKLIIFIAAIILFGCAREQKYETLICSNATVSVSKCTCKQVKDDYWKIDCSNTDLNTTWVGTMDDTVGYKEVSFANSQLKKLTKNPDQKWRAQTVELFNVEHNTIDEIEKDYFDTMTSLKTLNLADNRLDTVKSEWFTGLATTLETLYLSENRISKIPEKAFDVLTSLKHLKLDKNPIVGLTPTSFTGLNMLITLSLDNNFLSSIDDATLTPMTKLETLSIRFARLEHLPKLVFPMLKTVSFDGNPIETIHEYTFVNVSHLGSISFDLMPKLSTIEKNAFSGLVNVEHLRISDSPLVKSIPQAAFDPMFGFSNKLVTVDFSNNSLTTLPSDLFAWSAVQAIYLTGNRWNCTCQTLWMLDARINVIDGPQCTYPSTLAKQNMRNMTKTNFPNCRNRLVFATPKIFIAMTFMLLLSATVLITWYIWTSRKDKGGFFRTTSKPAYAYKNLAMNQEEVEQQQNNRHNEQHNEDDDDAPYPSFESNKTNLV